MNPFRQAAAEARNPDSRNYSPALAKRIETEGKIVSKLVKQGLASGYLVSVWDGEEWVVKLSRDYKAIMAALFSTDEDGITFRDPKQLDGYGRAKRVGQVQLIYGNNGYDVVSDWSAPDLDAFSEWMKPITQYADSLEY